MTGAPTVIVSQNRTPTASQEALAAAVLAGLAQRPELRAARVAHLYDLAPGGPGVELLRSIPGDLIVLAWMYPRSAYWVLRAHGVAGRLEQTASSLESAVKPSLLGANASPRERRVWCLDLRNYTNAEPLLAEVLALADRARGVASEAADQATSATGDRIAPAAETTAARWYPVIDRDRCNHCGECLNFCLFGVFAPGTVEGVAVAAPDACRNGCPACSRVCPEGAILFPQHHDPAIAGDPAASRAGLKLDLSQLFAGGDDLLGLANQERAAALAALAGLATPAGSAGSDASTATTATGQTHTETADRAKQPSSGREDDDTSAADAGDALDRLLDGLDRAEL